MSRFPRALTSRTSRATAAALVFASALAAGPTSPPASASELSSSLEPLPGAPFNDPDCTPDAEHPHPVVFLHGTSANADQFVDSARNLVAHGYCVYAVNYGREASGIQALSPAVFGTADLLVSAREVADFIDGVLAQTGAEKVSIVAHSQGAMQAKNYISRFGNHDKVDRVVALGASLHGTTLNGQSETLGGLVEATPNLAQFFASTAGVQQLVGSPAIADADSYPDTAAGVTYTSLYSPHDTTVTPNSSSHFNPVPGANVVNLDVEAACSPDRPILHPDMPRNATMTALTRWGLERAADEVSPSPADCTIS